MTVFCDCGREWNPREGNRSDDRLGCSIDDHDAGCFLVLRKYELAIGRNRDALHFLRDWNRRQQSPRSHIENTHAARLVIRGVDPLAVRRDHEHMGVTGASRNLAYESASLGVDDVDGID